MKSKIIITIIIFLFVVNNSDCQRFRVECDEIVFDSVLVLDYVLKGKEIDKSIRKSYQSRGQYFKQNDTTIYQNIEWVSPTQAISVKFYNGIKPYVNQWGSNEESGIDIDQNTLYSGMPGIFNLTVIDSMGTRDSCYINFYMPKAIDLTVCSMTNIDLSRYIDYFYSQELLISYELENILDTVKSIDEIPQLSLNQEKIELKYLDAITLEEVHSILIKITNLQPGDKCDDRDDCTYNDYIREDCKCAGTHIIDSLKVNVVYSDACFNYQVTLSTEVNNYEQSWTGKYISGYENSIKISVKEPTTIRLRLKDSEGCELHQEHRIIPKRQLEIKSDSELYCNGEDVMLRINDTEVFETIKWYDEFANILDTVNTTINIQRPGKYTAYLKTDNCYKTGEIDIKSSTYVDYKIKIENNYLCDLSETLRITPPLDRRYNQSVIWRRLSKEEFENNSSNWKVVQENVDSIIISDTGLYSLEIIEEKPYHNKSCKSYDQVVVYDDLSHKLIKKYISNHLKYHEWKFKYIEQKSIPFKWSSVELSSRSILELNLNENEIILETLDGNKRFVLQEQFLKRLNRIAGFSSGKKIKGYLLNLDCGNIKNIEKYLESIDKDTYPFVCIFHIDKSVTNPNDWMVYVYTQGEFGRFDKLID